MVKIKLENHILKKYNLEVKLDGDMTYGFLPKPHFFIKDTTINYLGENLAKTDFTKIYISVDNFFSIDNLKIKNLFFKRTEFNINYKNYNFFKQTLNSINDKDNVNFKNSRLFYNNKNEDVIFLAKMKNLNFFKNNDFNQQLNANFEIFNIPLKVKIINDQFQNNFFIDLDSNKLRVNVQNDVDYGGENKIGMMNLSFFNKLKKINYVVKKNSLTFKIDKKDTLKGKIDFKPFYLSTDFRLKQINFLKIFETNSILLNLLNTGVLNNQNLNAVVNVYIDKIKHTNYLNNIVLKTYFEEGNIVLKDSSLSWKDSRERTTLEIICDTKGLPVYVDNQLVGYSPLKNGIDVLPGWHKVGYFPNDYSQDSNRLSPKDKMVNDILVMGRLDVFVEEGKHETIVLNYQSLDEDVIDYNRRFQVGTWTGFSLFFLMILLMSWGLA